MGLSRPSAGLGISGQRMKSWGFRAPGLGPPRGVKSLGGFRVWSSGLRVESAGFRV